MKIERLVCGSLSTNCYIIYDEKTSDALLVDPAGNPEIISDALLKLKVNVKYIVITHAHCDHIAALDDVKKITGAKICIGKCDAASLYDSHASLCAYFGTNVPKTQTDVLLKDNDKITVGDITFMTIHTPGHTRGSICLYSENVLISGDTLFNLSVGRCDFPGGSMSELMRSIKEKLFCLPDDTKVYPGHGDATSIGYEKNNNPLVI